MPQSVNPVNVTVQTIMGGTYTYQLSDSGSCILRSNDGEMMRDTLLILPANSFLTIKNADNMGGALTLICGDNALIDGQQNSLIFSGLSAQCLISDGANWWLI